MRTPNQFIRHLGKKAREQRGVFILYSILRLLVVLIAIRTIILHNFEATLTCILVLALFFVPLVLICVSQGLTYPFVASIVSHGPLGVNEFTAYSMGQSAVFLVGTVCAAMVTTGMMFCRSREGLREYARLNGALLAASVAPTLGKLSAIFAPLRPSGAVHSIAPRLSRIFTPRLFRAFRWRSIGLGPSSQPPGKVRTAFFLRPSREPRKIIEPRISRIRLSGISAPFTLSLFTSTAEPSRFTSQPRYRSIRAAALTSERRGQLNRTFSPSHKSAAESTGRILFFAP